MNIQLDTVADIAKSANFKREKQSDDTELVIAHLKFDACVITREHIDELLGRPIGWAQSYLFDDQGVPIAHMEISLPKLQVQLDGVIRGTGEGAYIRIAKAELSDVVLMLVTHGARLAGTISWAIAGDEAGHLEPLLGRQCGCKWQLIFNGQQDLLRAA